MAENRNTAIRNLSSEDIQREVSQAKQDLNRMKFDHSAKGLESPKVIKETKKDIARMLTEARAREIKDLDAKTVGKRSKILLRRKQK